MTRVLVVEDDPRIRGEVTDILRFEGYEVAGAENGLRALDVVEATRPEVVICDWMMPGLDGYGLLERLRADERFATLPFVFLTARADRASMRLGMERGADDYLTKPFTIEELLRAVRSALDRAVRITHEADERVSTFCRQLTLTLPHELRTPLNVVMGYAELLSEDAPDPSLDVKECAAHILAASRRLHRLTENFLLSAQLEILVRNGSDTPRSSRVVDADEVLRVVTRDCARAAERLTDVQIDPRTTPSLVRIEPAALEKMLAELLDNAFKFSPPGSPVTIGARTEGAVVVLAIADHGRGLTPEQVATIRAYTQFDRQRFEQQGMGLGFSIARSMARLWGGTLEIDSGLDQGTRVWVTLPAACDHPREAAA